MNNKPKKIHFIGICGVAMSAIAAALREKGYEVTGSDAGFFPPVSTYLQKLGVLYYAGWHPEKMIENGLPDLVVVGNVASSQNPEFVYAQENKIPYKSFPEVLSEMFVKKNSIVIVGTYGKTTSSALLAKIFSDAGLQPSYMTGGLTQDNSPAGKIGDGDWSILEGDEYKTSKWDNEAKFFHYKPTHLLLSAASWDHADMYPDEASYFAAFAKLLKMIPVDGKIIYCADRSELRELIEENFKPHPNPLLKERETSTLQGEAGGGLFLISYGTNPVADYHFGNVIESADGLEFKITHGAETWQVKSKMLGAYNAENITGCFAMAMECDIAPEKIIKSIAEFAGMKRRMEKRNSGNIPVYDEHAHSPVKAASALKTLKTIYPSSRIFAIFEPNSGNRSRLIAKNYDNAFNDADTVIIPTLSKLKTDTSKPKSEQPLEGEELAKIISRTHKNAIHIPDDSELVNYLAKNTAPCDVIIFLGAHGFRGMIEETVARINF